MKSILKNRNLEQETVHNNERFTTRQWHEIDAPIWAFFRQLSSREQFVNLSVAPEEVLFIINYRTDITQIDVYEGYKSDLTDVALQKAFSL